MIFRCAKTILKKKNVNNDFIGIQYYGKVLLIITHTYEFPPCSI